MKPPQPNAELGFDYVGISRVTELDGHSFIGPSMRRTLRYGRFKHIQQEYARLIAYAH